MTDAILEYFFESMSASCCTTSIFFSFVTILTIHVSNATECLSIKKRQNPSCLLKWYAGRPDFMINFRTSSKILLPREGIISHCFISITLSKVPGTWSPIPKSFLISWSASSSGRSHLLEEQENSILFLYSKILSEGITSFTGTSFNLPICSIDSITCLFLYLSWRSYPSCCHLHPPQKLQYWHFPSCLREDSFIIFINLPWAHDFFFFVIFANTTSPGTHWSIKTGKPSGFANPLPPKARSIISSS